VVQSVLAPRHFTAAVAAGRLLAALAPRRVLFVGTCGTYDSARIPLDELVAVSEVIATSLEEVRGGADRPGVERVHWTTQFRPPFPPHPVATTPAVTVTEAGARALAAVAPLEHLELSGVLEACRQAGVPCGAALAVVNEVGPEAHGQWKARHAQGSARLIKALFSAGVFSLGS